MANSASHPSRVGEMSSNALMMDYGGGDLLLACPPLVGGSLRIGLCVQALGGDQNMAWRLSFSDEKRVRGVCDTRRAIQIYVLPLSYLTLPYLANLITYLRTSCVKYKCNREQN